MIYLAVCTMHIMQQMLRNRALRIVCAPEADFVVQALVMAVIVQLLHSHNMEVVAWALATPAIVVSALLIFWFVMMTCSI